MQLGLTLGYWGRAMPEGVVQLAVEAERAGFDAAWTGESLVGPAERIRGRLQAWEASPVTMLNVAARTPEECRMAAELVKG